MPRLPATSPSMKRYILPILLLLPMTSSCQITDLANGDEKIQIEQLDAELEVAEADASDAEAKLIAATKKLKEAFEEGDRALHAEAVDELEVARAEVSEAGFRVRVLTAQLRDITSRIQERSFGAIFDFIDPFLPAPLRPWTEPLALLMGSLIFRRSRQALGKSVGSLAKGNILDVVLHLGRSLGLLHTSTSTAKVAEAADLAERNLKLQRT